MICKRKTIYPLLLFGSICLLLWPATSMSGLAAAEAKKIDIYSYNLGVIGAFSEVVSLGIKKLALSAPLTAGDIGQIMPEAKKIAKRNGVRLYLETDFLVTDLFPAEITREKQVLLIYLGSTLKEYLALKTEKKKLVKNGGYQGEPRQEVARQMGRLLSYPEATINRMLKETNTGVN